MRTKNYIPSTRENVPIDILVFLDKLFYLNNVLYTTVNDSKIKQAEKLRENLINDFSEHYLNNY